MSSPPPRSTRPKAKPTVTPRSFRRFFTPRTSHGQGQKLGGTRNALSDITSTGNSRLNRVSKRRSPRKDSIRIFDEDENPELGSNNLQSNRKRALCSPDSSPPSSPLKRLRHSNTKSTNILAWQIDSDEEQNEGPVYNCSSTRTPVERSRFRRTLGQVSRREMDMPFNAGDRSLGDYAAGTFVNTYVTIAYTKEM